MKLRITILSLAAAALLLGSVPAQAHDCDCSHRSHRTAYRVRTAHHTHAVDYAYVTAPRASASAWIKTDVEPDEARVYLDGRYVGTADDFDGWPRKLRVSAGTHRLTFRLRGHVPYSVVVHAYPGRVVDVDYWLKS